jgi:hypothetical protein
MQINFFEKLYDWDYDIRINTNVSQTFSDTTATSTVHTILIENNANDFYETYNGATYLSEIYFYYGYNLALNDSIG